MRTRYATTVGLIAILALGGCAAMQERRWSTCAAIGAGVGAGVGAGTAAGLVNAYERGADREKATVGAGVGGALAGATVGAILGHLICDPEVQPPPPPPPAAAPSPPAARKVTLSADTYFDFDKSTLKPEGKARIDAEVVGPMKAHPQLRASVEGHTDSIGSDAYNQRLSERRANAVRDYLVTQGIASSRITTRGYGESKPIADNATKEGRAKNRRVEITEE